MDEYGKTGWDTYENVKIKRVGDNLFKIMHGELRGELATYDTLNMYYIPVDSKRYEKPWILTKVRMVEMAEMKYSEFVDIIKEELYDIHFSTGFLDNFEIIYENIKNQTEICGIIPSHIREQLFNEAFEIKSERDLRKIIRTELAAWLFDMFKKRSMWI